MDFDLKKLSQLITDKLGIDTEIISFDKAGSGYHSEGYKLSSSNGKTYFLKYVRSHDLGFEFPERQVASLLISNGMTERASKYVRPVGVVVLNEDEEVILPRITPSTKVLHIQEFAGIGTSYSEILARNSNKKFVDDEDREQLQSIADELVKIHSVKHPSKDKKILSAVYDDGLRAMLTNPELSLMVLSEFPSDYKVLDIEGQKEVISLMYENIKAWMGRSDRLTALQGDFWGANIFFKDDKRIFIIDFSRIPWGDPAIDAGWFLAEYLWNYHATGNKYYRELTEDWLDIYEKKSGDKEIRKAICLVLGWIGIVQIYPRWYPNLDVEKGTKFINHIKEILKRKEFFWND